MVIAKSTYIGSHGNLDNMIIGIMNSGYHKAPTCLPNSLYFFEHVNLIFEVDECDLRIDVCLLMV